MHKSGVKTPSQRQLKVAEQLKHLVAQLLLTEKNFFNPKVPFVLMTVTEVRISPDLKNASVFIAISKEVEVKAALESLDKINHILKKKIAKSLQLRYVPKLKFLHDDTLNVAEKIESLLAHEKVQQDINKDSK